MQQIAPNYKTLQNILNTPNYKAKFIFWIHQITLDDPERPENIDNCTKDEERGDF